MSYPLTTFEAINDERMSDAQYAGEVESMERVRRAQAALIDALKYAHDNSTIMDSDAKDSFADWCGDNLPPDWEWELREMALERNQHG